VKELNGRFADWYYIISEDTYRKIHLTRNDIVKKKEKKDEKKDGEKKDEKSAAGHEGHKHEGDDHKDASPVDEFDKLKKEGPEGKP